MFYKTLGREQTTEQHEPHNNMGWSRVLMKDQVRTRRATLVKNPVVILWLAFWSSIVYVYSILCRSLLLGRRLVLGSIFNINLSS